MREYERRIREHQGRLPKIREQVTAALVLFMVASLMLTVVTFSWITLSTAPEVSGATVMIAANGNLEIALASQILRDDAGKPVEDENGNVIPLAPGASEVGDSGKDLFDKNTTWGNLVNLSDSIYGLENIVLRPATLKTKTLLSEPLYAAKYDADGRIIELRSDFAYTQWNSELGLFQGSSDKGVKAISSVKYNKITYDNPLLGVYDEKVTNIDSVLEQARGEFNKLGDRDQNPNIAAIDGIMSTYMNGTLRLNVNAEPCSVEDIERFHAMMEAVYNGPMKTMGTAYMEIIELYQLDTYGQNNSTDLNYERFTDLDKFCDEILEYVSVMNNERVNSEKAEIVLSRDFPDLLIYLQDRAKLKKYIDELASFKGSNATWGNIKHIVNYIVDIDTCEINGSTINGMLSNISISSAMKLLNMLGAGKANQNNAVVKIGLMKRLDLMLNNGEEGFKIAKATITIDKAALKARVEASSMSSMSGMVDSVIKGETGIAEANITTDAVKTGSLGTSYADAARAKKIVGAQSVTKTFVAQDTYGLSLDFWVRTNALNSFLTLDGTVVYEYTDVTRNITLYNADGEATTYENVQIYVASIEIATTEKGETTTSTQDEEIFKINEVWYSGVDNTMLGQAVTEELEDGTERSTTRTLKGTPEKKQNRTPIGYNGSNRIWTEEELAGLSESQYRTTQGAGSCYTYYADPAEKMQINQILSALKIAFVDANGQILAKARLATEFCFSEYGKHTVPIMLEESAMDTGTVDANGDVRRAITTLEKNEATFITAIIYLDGNEVTNDKVLSFSNIEGNFNIQFGNTYALNSIENEELMGDQMIVSGEVRNESGAVNPTVDYLDGMSESGYKTTVTLTISGTQPTNVHAYFLRRISATQGTRQEKITFERKAGTTDQWIAEVKFYAPGEYIMRSVIVDGVERDLSVADGSDPPTVTINGFGWSNFRGANGRSYTYRTANNSVDETFYVNISAGEGAPLPRSVEALFQTEDGKSVTVTFTDSDRDTTYEGTAVFRSSGTYTCNYLLIDGEYYELPEPIEREIYTGLKVSVWFSPTEGEVFYDVEEKSFSSSGYQYLYKGYSHKFDVQMRIYDSEGKTIEGLTNVSVYYSRDTDANLTWDPATKYYVGRLQNAIDAPGYYTFERAVVGNETIDSTRSAMYIRAVSSDPVSYIGVDGTVPDQIVALSGYQGPTQPERIVALKFQHAESANIFGKFSKITSEGTTYIIIPATRGTTVGTSFDGFYFQLPDENGVWTLEEVKMSMVYDGETETLFFGDDSLESLFQTGAAYVEISDGEEDTNVWDSAADYYVIEPDEDWVSTIILKTLDDITPPSNYSGNAFMTAYSVKNTVTMNNPLANVNGVSLSVSNVTLTYDHHSSGNITWDGDTSVANIVQNLSADGNKYSDSLVLKFPGTYTVILNYTLTINGQSYTIQNGAHQFTLSYKMPTVTISKVTPEGSGYAYDKTTDSQVTDSSTTTGSGCNAVTTYTINSAHQLDGGISEISSDKLSATVYFGCLHDGTGEYSSDQKYHAHISDAGYFNPSVTLNLAGLGSNFSSATLNFSNNNAHLYKNVSYTTSGLNGTWKTTDAEAYIWTKNGECMRYVGYCQSQKSRAGDNINATGQKTVVGTITANSLDVIVDGVTYTLTLPTTVTINNPY